MNPKIFIQFIRLLGFMAFYFKEVLLSNLKVAKDVLSPNPTFNCGIVEVPVKKLNDFGVAWLANMVSMTPGTLSLTYDSEKSSLCIHTMYMDDEASFIKSIQEQYENRIARIIQP
jgi:multicomponent Na+:H+ antiporter subunit E